MGQLAQFRPPSDAESEQAQIAVQTLAKMLKRTKRTALSISIHPDKSPEETVSVPREAFEMFIQVLSHMANGAAVTIVPVNAELTTQQAAELLNVSRPFVVQLIEEGKLPARKVGTRRRVRCSDLMTFKQKDDAERKRALAELVEDAEDLGLEY